MKYGEESHRSKIDSEIINNLDTMLKEAKAKHERAQHCTLCERLLARDLLTKALADQEMEISFPNLKIGPSELVSELCYKILDEIKAVLDDDSQDDSLKLYKINNFIRLYSDT